MSNAENKLAAIPVRVVRVPEVRRPWGESIAKWAKHRRKAFELMNLRVARGGNTMPEGTTARVPCNGCNACCRSGLEIHLEDFESGEGLDTFKVADGTRYLRHNPDGTCVHLIDNKCSVYSKRPASCRIYDCRDLAAASASHAEDATAVNEVIRAWKPEIKTKEDEDIWFILSAVTMPLIMKGMPACTALVYAMRDLPHFLPEADAIRESIRRARSENPHIEEAVRLMHDPNATPEQVEAALTGKASL